MTQGASAAIPLAQMVVALIAVLGVILALAWVTRRVQRGARHGTALLRSHASLSVGARERAVLVEAAGQFLLLGVANGQVRLLHRYEQPPELPPSASGTGSQLHAYDFVAQLREVMRKGK